MLKEGFPVHVIAEEESKLTSEYSPGLNKTFMNFFQSDLKFPIPYGV